MVHLGRSWASIPLSLLRTTPSSSYRTTWRRADKLYVSHPPLDSLNESTHQEQTHWNQKRAGSDGVRACSLAGTLRKGHIVDIWHLTVN